MKIRNATPADLDEILNIEMQCFPIQEAATKEQIAVSDAADFLYTE